MHFGQWNYLISNAPISIIFRVGDNCTLLLFIQTNYHTPEIKKIYISSALNAHVMSIMSLP